MNILFLGGAKRVSIGRMFIEAGQRLGIDVRLGSYELSDRVPIACIAQIAIGRRWNAPDVLDHLGQVIADERIDMVIPFVDPAIELAALCRERYGVWTPTGNPEVAAAMLDKLAAHRAFVAAGLPVPTLYDAPPTDAPVIAKPRMGSASKGIHIALPGEPLPPECLDPDHYILQQYIHPAEEYTIDCYAHIHTGKVLACVPRLRLETAGGEVTRTITVDSPTLVEMAHTIIKKSGMRGAITVQILRDTATGNYYMMEVNPRLGGGAVTAVHAGVDIPEMILRQALGFPVEPQAYRPGVEIARYMQEVVFFR